VPPRTVFSITATFAPWLAARRAVAIPPLPQPITTKSNLGRVVDICRGFRVFIIVEIREAERFRDVNIDSGGGKEKTDYEKEIRMKSLCRSM
jgi:hypothetical protein